jgi:hypothetical protein
MDKFMASAIGVIIHCEGGHVLVPDYSSAIAHDPSGKEIKRWSGADDHYGNFIKAVRSRKVKDLNSDILEGHLSSALCHTGNISYLLGKRSKPDAIREAIRGDQEAWETFERMVDHLKSNGVDIAGDSLVTLGPVLRMNPGREVFKKNDAANALLKRDYRKPFVVPDRV